MSREEQKLVVTVVQKLMRSEAIAPANSLKDQFLSNIFLRPKKYGCFCTIMNLIINSIYSNTYNLGYNILELYNALVQI